MPPIPSTSGRLHGEFVRLLFLQTHRETDRFFADSEHSGVQPAQTQRDMFHFRRSVFDQQLKSRVGLALAKAAALLINLNLDGAPIASKSHTHPSHSQTSRLLTSSLSLCVPVGGQAILYMNYLVSFRARHGDLERVEQRSYDIRVDNDRS